jgi:hypothetical protein
VKFSFSLICSLILATGAVAQDELSEADKQLVAAVREAGGQAMQLAKNDTRLTVAFHLSDKEIGDQTLALLKDAPNLYSLNLRGTKVTDAGLQQIAGLKSLVRLHLEKTAVTDAGLDHLA